MSTSEQNTQPIRLQDLVFVGFNKQVIALDRYNGKKVWTWKSPEGSGYPAILVDGDRIIVSVAGYTYCLEPSTGSLVWENELKGHGMGITCLASLQGTSTSSAPAQIAATAAAVAATTNTHGIGR